MHLKTIVINRLKWDGFDFVSLPRSATPHKRGVHYFHACVGVKALWGAMDTRKEGQHYKKRIVVRPSRFRDGLFELYTYHFPTRWSAACVANRELIKEAQRRAHALEHDHSVEALEWRLRFFRHYFRVFKGGAKPEPGLKRYSRFYQYTYVAIYRQLQAEARKTQQPDPQIDQISFEPVEFRPSIRSFASPLSRAYNCYQNRHLQPPDIQQTVNPQNVPRTTVEFAHVEKKQ